MRVEFGLSLGTLYGFLLVLARVSGLVALVPLPGWRNGPAAVRVVLAVALTLALLPAWPVVAVSSPPLFLVAGWALAEAGFGLALGLAVSFLMEGFQLAAQIFGLQAGYSYASMIDPNSEADSGILQVFTFLAAGLLLFTTGFDREVLRVLAASLETVPAGTFVLTLSSAEGVLRLGSAVFVTGMRLAMPVVALLLLIDVALALLGRLQTQLQLLSLAFPVKMLAALAMLAAVAPWCPALFRNLGRGTLDAMWALVRR